MQKPIWDQWYTKSHLAKVDGYIQKGIDEGASILHGGVSDSNQKGFFAKPTLFDNVKLI